MKNILKVLLVTILAVATVFPLVACGGGADVTTPEADVTTPEATTPEVTTPEVTTPEVTTPEPEPAIPTHTHNTDKYVATIAAEDSGFGVGYELWGCTEEDCGYCELYVSEEADGHNYVDGACACAGAEAVTGLEFKAVIDSTGEWAKYEDAATGLYFLLKIPKFYDFETTFFGEDENDEFTTYKDDPLNLGSGCFTYANKKPLTITEGTGDFDARNGAIISFTLTMNAFTTNTGNSQFMAMYGIEGDVSKIDYIMMTSAANDDGDPSTPQPKSSSGYKNVVKFELGVGSRIEFVFTPNGGKTACKVYVDGVLYADAINTEAYRSAVTYLRIGQQNSDDNLFDIDDLIIGRFSFEDSADVALIVDSLDFSRAGDHDYAEVINGFIARSCPIEAE